MYTQNQTSAVQLKPTNNPQAINTHEFWDNCKKLKEKKCLEQVLNCETRSKF